MADVTTGALDGLRREMTGTVSRPGEPGYDEAANIWNAAIARRPAVVARCASPDDVARALTFAGSQGLEVSVRGGGHNYAGFALTEGRVMIDLTPTKAVHVDPVTRRGTCGGGTTWGEFDAATQAYGLAVPGGFVSRTVWPA
jgi:FAD/FMN-containing dehydrogenase